ncbi:MAG TPA: adenylate/guanylate cyclase domain-containing protein [Candidatus Limnocylindrales bacterium]|nr:adenylate/guanylate cyclase domain-containing protein [Candidatus Limnocylindrales bacterium]
MCGTSLVQDEAAGEVRRLITLVTSDLKGSTALGERLDPEALREVLNRYFSVMRVVFESHGGTIEKIIGDAIVAVFGLPFRRDDDAVRALEAAAETQRALALLNDELDQGWGVRLVNRTGVATGEVTFGRSEGGQHVLLGPPVDLSTVMEQNAPPQEVLIAESTYDAVRDVVEVEAIEPVAAKGSDETFAAFRLISVAGREAPLDAVALEPSPGMRICPSCGEESPERYRLCNTCGASLIEHVARESRRTVTIVFAMPKVRTRSGGAATPEALRDVMSSYFESMRAALERHGGTVEKFIGDAVMAVFGLPVRHEDDALRAIRAAADMQASLPALNERFLAGRDIELENHIGVNTGEVIAGDASTGQRLVTGDAVNTAARLEQAAGSGEIVLGDLTYRLARDQIEIEFIPPLTLKGKAEPVPAYRLVSIGTQAGHRDSGTPFVGRTAEMGRLSDALFDAIGNKGARLISVIGDAGVGKSRLIREFASTASSQARVVRGRCLPYGDGITFWPLAEVVRDAAGITAEDSPDAAIEKIRGLLPASGRRERAAARDERSAIVDRVAAAMNLTTAQFPVPELLWGGRRLLEALARDQPLTMIVDDIHSAETTFLEFLDHLLENVDGAAILLLCTARHELAERHDEWVAAHEGETIRLEPLTESDAGQIVEELLGALEPAVQARIAEASEGNPLYVEQIVSMLVETGAIERGMDGWVARAGGAALQIPPTVQALVASRLDALGADERGVVEPASVIGLSFPEDAVAELVEADVREHLEAELTILAGKQLVRRASGDEPIYRFGHQVIRDTAYGSLLKRMRAALHERFVVWAERVNKERGRELEFEEILGFHLEQAYRYRTEIGLVDDDARSVGERAATKLGSAGRRALARGDIPASVSLLRRAIDVLPREAAFRLELMIDLAEGLLQQGSFDAAGLVLDDVRAIADERDDEPLRVRGDLVRMWMEQFRSGGEGGAARALAAATAAIEVLEPIGDAAGLARAWRLRMVTEVLQGQLEEAGRDAEQVIAYARQAGDTRLSARSAGTIAYVLLHGPTPVEEAIRRCEELVAGVEGDRTAEAVLLGTLGVLRSMLGSFDDARALYRRGQAISAELGSGLVESSSSIDSSRIELLANDIAAAERELRRDYEALTAINETYFRSTIAAYLAQVLWQAGDADGALAFSQVAEEIGDVDDVLTQVPWRSARAKVLASRGEVETAKRLATEAVELAAATPMTHLRADALTDLAEVLGVTGDHESAGPPFWEALELYEQKGDVVSAQRLRERIGAVSAA